MQIDLLQEAETRETFCILPFNAVQINQYQVLPCCKMGALQPVQISWKETFDRYFANEQLRAMQESFLRSESPAACKKCFLGPKQSLYPDQKLSDFRHSVQQGLINPVITVAPTVQFLNILLTNACNLRCRHCSPGCSSSLDKIWDDELARMTGVSKTPLMKSDELIDELINNPKFNDVKNVLLSGGEPLMLKRLAEVAGKFAERGAEKIGIVTNLSDDPFNFLEYFNELGKEVYATVTVSVDGDRIIHPYHRNQLDIDAFIANAKKLNSMENVHVCVMIAVDAINILTFTNLIDFVFELFDGSIFFQLSIVENGFLHVRVLPQELKQLALDRLNYYIDNFPHKDKYAADSAMSRLLQVRQVLESAIKFGYNRILFDRFIEYLTALDKKYGTSFEAVIPEFSPFLQQTAS